MARAAEIRREWEEQQDDFTLVKKKRNRFGRKIVDFQVIKVEENPKEVEKKRVESDVQEMSPTNRSANISFNADIAIQHEHAVESQSDHFDMITYLTKHQLNYKDNRAKGGALWVIGDKHIGSILKPLKEYGYEFIHMPKGGYATKQEPAWYTKN